MGSLSIVARLRGRQRSGTCRTGLTRRGRAVFVAGFSIRGPFASFACGDGRSDPGPIPLASLLDSDASPGSGEPFTADAKRLVRRVAFAMPHFG